MEGARGHKFIPESDDQRQEKIRDKFKEFYEQNDKKKFEQAPIA